MPEDQNNGPDTQDAPKNTRTRKAPTETTQAITGTDGLANAGLAVGQRDAVKITMPDENPYKHDETVEGGKYIVRGRLVNAHGLLIDEEGTRLKADGTPFTQQETMAELRMLAAGASYE